MSKLGEFLSKVGFHIEARGPELDLVCGMELPEETKCKVKYKNKIYFFCSESCRSHFEMDPEKYIG
ncbi:MAG: YHS domain-containing protein [bacterium]|nr:YHS domain-containing protein [bacterium]